jgi:hypothetical protein
VFDIVVDVHSRRNRRFPRLVLLILGTPDSQLFFLTHLVIHRSQPGSPLQSTDERRIIKLSMRKLHVSIPDVTPRESFFAEIAGVGLGSGVFDGLRHRR